MSDYQRGTVTKISFEITYPDGSTKISEVDNPSEVQQIAFTDDYVSEGDREAFNASTEDWKQNPSMIITPAGGGGIPFCTHNGCKI